MDWISNRFSKISKTFGGNSPADSSTGQNGSRSTAKFKGKVSKRETIQVESQIKSQQYGSKSSHNHAKADSYTSQRRPEVEERDDEGDYYDSANEDSEGCATDEDLDDDQKHTRYQKHFTTQAQKSNAWKKTTKRVAGLTRSHTQRSKDSGFSGSFRNSKRRAKRKDEQREQTTHDRLQAAQDHSIENLDDEPSARTRPIKTSGEGGSQSDHTELEVMVRRRDRRHAEADHGDATTSAMLKSDNTRDEEVLPIPINLHRELKSVLRSAKVPYYMISHDPENIYKIIIDGYQVSRLQSRLKVALRKSQQYTKFSITTKDINLQFSEKHVPTLDLWSKQRSKLRCMLANNVGERPCVIELMLKGNDGRRRQLAVFDIFAGTTTHSLLSVSQRRLLMISGICKSDWQKITEDCWKKMPFMLVPEHSDVDITSRPFPTYRYWFRVGNKDEYSFLADLVIFKLDKMLLEEGEWLSRDGSLSSQYGRVISNLDVGRDGSQGVVGSIWNCRHERDLLSLINRRIICAGKMGRVVPSPDVEQNGWVMGLHLCFVLDHDKSLINGDCGSLVYLLGETEQEDTIVGMFFGTCTLYPRIQQAVVLSPIIKQLQANKDFHVQDMLALHSPRRPPSRTRPESGYGMSQASSCVSLASQR